MRSIVGLQTDLGWQQETTLYGRHFEEDHKMSIPGRLHVTDILEVAPTSRRTVYVQATQNADIDNARIASVEQVVAELTGGTELVPVVLRKGRDYSRPASEVKIINDLYNGSVPSPRLGAGAGAGAGSTSATAAVAGP
jgi:hypothetical protein